MPAEENETSSNYTDLQSYEPTPTEVFLLSRAGSQLAFTQIGTGSVRNARTKKWQDVRLLFDQASTDCWVTPDFVETMGCKRLDDWRGYLTTINGREHIDRPAVEFGIFNYETQQVVRIQAIVSSGEISRKPKILTERFNRLCSAFSLKNGQVDNSEGNCQVLIGLKNQSIQTTRICRKPAESWHQEDD